MVIKPDSCVRIDYDHPSNHRRLPEQPSVSMTKDTSWNNTSPVWQYPIAYSWNFEITQATKDCELIQSINVWSLGGVKG
jgi:hypothetical protein